MGRRGSRWQGPERDDDGRSGIAVALWATRHWRRRGIAQEGESTMTTRAVPACGKYTHRPFELINFASESDPYKVTLLRSEERRVGKEWRSRWTQSHDRKQDK